VFLILKIIIQSNDKSFSPQKMNPCLIFVPAWVEIEQAWDRGPAMLSVRHESLWNQKAEDFQSKLFFE
jgi:hypothetical protein